MINKNNFRLLELDALRGLAAISVVLYHYTTRYSELYPNYEKNYFNFSYGNLGVQMFFILSGYVIFLSINNVGSALEFLKKRAIRLYPAYIICVLITFTLVRCIGLENREVTIFEGILNLSMFQSFIPGIRYVDGAYWSLAVEITFYMYIFLIIYFNKVEKIFNIIVCWMIFSTLLYLLTLSTSSHVISFLYYKSISNYIHLFIAGISFYFLKSKFNKKYVIILAYTLTYQFIISNDLVEFLIVISMYVVFWMTIIEKLKFLNNKLLVFLGSISYSLYLVHQNIGYLILNLLNQMELKSQVWMVIPLAFSILLSFIITKYVEKPAISRLKKLLFSKKYKKAS